MMFSIVIAFMLFIQSNEIEYKLSPKFSESISVLFEKIFSPASNSNNHYIVNQKDLQKLKVIVQTRSDSTDVIIKSLKDNYQSKKDSLNNSIKEVDSLTHMLSEKLLVENRNYQRKRASIFGNFFLITALSISLLLLITMYFKLREKYKYSFESLIEVEKNFDSHKKSAIERERKLLRELIDLKNKIEPEI
jgi:hypothetical protein